MRPSALWPAAVALATICFLTACATSRPTARTLSRFEFSEPQMGVPFRIVLYAPNASSASNAAMNAFERVRQLNAVLSDYDPDSELSRLCRDAPLHQPVPVSPDLWTMLQRSRQLSERTDGAFDATVGPLVNLWRRSRRRIELPPDDLLAETMARVGWHHLTLDRRRHTATFHRPGMRLDFGGIAKGYAADEAIRVLRQHGISRALVAAAGDVTASDPPPDQPGWRVDIGVSDVPDALPPRTVLLKQGSVSTSGDIFQRLEIQGRRYSHIVDPRTGIGLTDHSLVTVIARDGTTADSLATAISVLGPEKGLQLADATRGVAVLIQRAPSGRIESVENHRLARWLAPAAATR